LSGLKQTALSVRNYLNRQRNIQRGTNIYERDWDVLVLLDCARVDMMAAVADEFPFLSPVGTHSTPGTNSSEWMRVTFVEEYADEMSRTAHLTANPNSADTLDSEQFSYLDEIWQYGWDSETGTVPARTVTDRAITVGREQQPDRMIVHYMQPHPPFVPRPDIDSVEVALPGDEGQGMNVAELHEKGGYSIDELWEAHLANLRYVLQDIDLLRSNIDADRLVVSADHGQALGENGVLGHPCGSTVDAVRDVPWCVIKCQDSGEYQPDKHHRTGRQSVSVEEKLKNLGYK